jgi:repressor LexA
MGSDAELNELTPIQQEILHAIRRLARRNGHAACMREVLAEVRLRSTSALSYQYRELSRKGYLRWKARQPRTVEVRLPGEPAFAPEGEETGQVPGPDPEADEESAPPRADKVVWVPIVGRIAAGRPILAQESIEGYVPMPADVVGRDEGLFILEVVGDSMTGVGIFSRDWVVVRPLFQSPQNGGIVAATIEGVEPEGTVKTYQKVDRQIWLMPQNSAYTPIPGDRPRLLARWSPCCGGSDDGLVSPCLVVYVASSRPTRPCRESPTRNPSQTS